MWRVSPVSTETWWLGSQTKYLLWIKPDCWTIVTVAPQSFKVPTLQCAGVWFTTPAMGGAKAGRSSGTFGEKVLRQKNKLQRPILPTFRAWTGQFTLISTKKSKVKVCQITLYSPMFWVSAIMFWFAILDVEPLLINQPAVCQQILNPFA